MNEYGGIMNDENARMVRHGWSSTVGYKKGNKYTCNEAALLVTEKNNTWNAFWNRTGSKKIACMLVCVLPSVVMYQYARIYHFLFIFLLPVVLLHVHTRLFNAYGAALVVE